MQYTDFLQCQFEDTQNEYQSDYVSQDFDYQSQLENLAEQYAKLLAEKHVKEGKLTPDCSGSYLRPNKSVYQRYFNACQPLSLDDF